MPRMHIINAKGFIDAMNNLGCGKSYVAEIHSKDFVLEQEETFPLPGFEANEGYPHCCPKHTSLYNTGLERFMKFPDCCEQHKTLHSAPWFNKANYSYLPRKVVDTISYTWHCITTSIDNPNWYKEITDYIFYSARSFGQFPEGYGPPLGAELYLHNVEQNLINDKELNTDKKKQVLKYLKNFNEPSKNEHQTDLNLLIGTYKEWLKFFPFEISFFNSLKPFFEKQIPILAGKGDTNMYTGMTGFKVLTIPELIDLLVTTTSSILKTINTRELYQNNLLSDVKKIQIELVLANRRVEIDVLGNQKNVNRNGYIKLLKTWMKGEKVFLKEIIPLLADIEPPLDFTKDMISGIHMLQKNDTNEPCIMNVREGRPDKETAFRYWFKNFFNSRYPGAVVTAEEEQGNGRIDLKIQIPGQEEKIVEFKGWWNQDKKNAAEQICNYLTDFEKSGYVFMINHLKKTDIYESYQKFVTNIEMNYVEGSWKQISHESTSFTYCESMHQFSGKVKTIQHFIFNVYF